MNSDKIVIPVGKVNPNKQGVIKLVPEAMSALCELATETGIPIRRLASEIILQSVNKGLIEYRTGGKNGE